MAKEARLPLPSRAPPGARVAATSSSSYKLQSRWRPNPSPIYLLTPQLTKSRMKPSSPPRRPTSPENFPNPSSPPAGATTPRRTGGRSHPCRPPAPPSTAADAALPPRTAPDRRRADRVKPASLHPPCPPTRRFSFHCSASTPLAQLATSTAGTSPHPRPLPAPPRRLPAPPRRLPALCRRSLSPEAATPSRAARLPPECSPQPPAGMPPRQSAPPPPVITPVRRSVAPAGVHRRKAASSMPPVRRRLGSHAAPTA